MCIRDRYKDDSAVLDRLESIKQENKRRFAGYVARESGIILNTDAIFDVQVKRLHEYKRQLLNVLQDVYKRQTSFPGRSCAATLSMMRQIPSLPTISERTSSPTCSPQGSR